MANTPIIGSDGPDTLTGDNPTPGDDTIFGNGGNDTLSGLSGNDLLVGGPGADTLTGGTGADTFQDTASNFNGDHITDFLPGDRIQITDITLSSHIALNGGILSYDLPGGGTGSITIDNIGPGRPVVRAIANNGGVEIRLQQNAHNDFNGDSHSDVLWRNESGTVSEWLATGNGGFAAGPGSQIGLDWQIIGTGDFNGDGRDDILWRNTNGQLTEWLTQSDGTWIDNSAHAGVSLASNWQIAGTGDFNGDGHTDILWRNNIDGTYSEWLTNADGSFRAGVGSNVGPDWHVGGTGDFNGDGYGDVLWRNENGFLTEWLGKPDGSFTDNAANLRGFVDPAWQIAGTGDMNGDGLTDIMWRKADGTASEWLASSSGDGSFVAGAGSSVGFDWHIVGMGDYNGDAIDDVLWRNDNGNIVEWLGQPGGAWVSNEANASGFLANTWHVQDPFF